MSISLYNLVASSDSGWENFIIIIIFAGIAILKAVFGSISEKKQKNNHDKLKEKWQQRKSMNQGLNDNKSGPRFKPLNEDGELITNDTQRNAYQHSDSKPIRQYRPPSNKTNSDDNKKFDLVNDYVAETDAIEKYKKQIKLAKQRALAQKKLAQQIKQKAAMKKSVRPVKQSQNNAVRKTLPKPADDDIDLNVMLSNSQNLRTAFILTEILNKPISTR